MEKEQLDQLYADFKKYFALDESYVQGRLDKLFTNERDTKRLIMIVDVLKNYLKPDQTPEEVRMGAGKILLTNIDFSADYNMGYSVRERLTDLFDDVTSYKVNPYAVITKNVMKYGNYGGTYCDSDNMIYSKRSKDYYFLEIADAIERAFGFSRAEVVKIIESAPATIITETDVSKIYGVRNMLFSLSYNQEPFFRRSGYLSDEIKQGIARCCTLLKTKPEEIKYSFDYLKASIPSARIEEALAEYRKNGNTTMTQESCALEIFRSWVKDNFTILSLGMDIYDKEKYIRYCLKHQTSERNPNGYTCEFLFDNPISISNISSISMEKLRNNLTLNLRTLEFFYQPSDIQKAIKENPFLLGVKNSMLNTLLNRLLEDEQNGEKDLISKFIKLGKSCFVNANVKEDGVESIIKKLKQADSKCRITKDNPNLISIFVEIFFNGDSRVLDRINRVIEYKKQRVERGDKEVRAAIRKMPAKIKKSIIKNKDKRLALASSIEEINNKRFEIELLPKSAGYEELTKRERIYSRVINQLFDTFRSRYEENRLALQEKYPDIDIDNLYNFTIMKLEKTLSDKEPIVDLFEANITGPFAEMLFDGYEASQQENLFGGREVIAVVPKEDIKAVRSLTKSICEGSSHDLESTEIKIVSADRGGK